MHVATELMATPNTIPGGNSGPMFEDAYYFIVQDLKRLRQKEWADRSAVTLVRDFITFNDELAYVGKHYDFWKKKLTGLLRDVDELYMHPGESDAAVAMRHRVEWAIAAVDEHQSKIISIAEESRRSLDAVSSPKVELSWF